MVVAIKTSKEIPEIKTSEKSFMSLKYLAHNKIVFDLTLNTKRNERSNYETIE